MAEMNNKEHASSLERSAAYVSAGFNAESEPSTFLAGASALRRLDKLEEWIDKWLAWEPDWNSRPNSTRLIHSYGASRQSLEAFKAALTGNMQMPPESEGP